ncbi:hypothetical protein MUP77_02530 [Candidatus Bathyarchaeota archaeon]|nr:hypothetical protein [Candidatus Bathyarchaeota archaeon]
MKHNDESIVAYSQEKLYMPKYAKVRLKEKGQNTFMGSRLITEWAQCRYFGDIIPDL